MTACDSDDEEKLDASVLLQRLQDYDDVCVSSDQLSSQVIHSTVLLDHFYVACHTFLLTVDVYCLSVYCALTAGISKEGGNWSGTKRLLSICRSFWTVYL